MKDWRGYPLTRSAQAIEDKMLYIKILKQRVDLYLTQLATMRALEGVTVTTTVQSSSARDSMPGWERERAKAKAIRREIRELNKDLDFIHDCDRLIQEGVMPEELRQFDYPKENTRLCAYFPKCLQMKTCGFAHSVRVWISSALKINAKYKSETCRRPNKCPYHEVQACRFIHPVDVRVVRNLDGSFQGLAFGPDRSKKSERKENKGALSF